MCVWCLTLDGACMGPPVFIVLVVDEPNTGGYGSLCVSTQYQKFGFCVLFVLLLIDDMVYYGDGEEFVIYVVLIL